MTTHTVRFAGAILFAAAVSLIGRAAVAQDFIPFEISHGSFDRERNFYGWMSHIEGQQIGDVQAFTNAGGTKFWEQDSGVLMATGAFGLTNDGMQFGNVGLQRRYILDEIILGGGVWLDAGNSAFGNIFQQGSLSLELLRDDWSLRMSGYLPFGPRSRSVADLGTVANGGVVFQGHNLVASNLSTLRIDDVAMKGIDVELARSIGNLSGEVFVGYYNYQGRVGGQTNGIKGGVRGYIAPRLAGNVAISSDPIFGTNIFGGFTWFFGGSGGNAYRSIEDKLTIPVQRNQQVVVHDVRSGTAIAGNVVLTNGGTPITVNHVDDNGNSGDGTFENPHGSLTDANNDTNKNNRDVVYVYSGTTFADQDYQLAPNQRFLGEGDNNQHNVLTDQFGAIALPNVFGIGSPRPVIQAPNGMFAVNAANGSEISNFDFVNSGGTGGVFLGGLTGNAVLNRSRISGGVVGVDISGSTGQIDLVDVEFLNALVALQANNFEGRANINRTTILGGDTGIDIIGGTGQFTFTDTTITDSSGAAVNVNGGTAGIDFDATSQISQSTPTGTGLQFNNANGMYDFRGQVQLNGGDAGIDIIGSSGTFTFGDTTTITNPSGPAFNIEDLGAGGTINYNGSIIISNNHSIVSIFTTAVGSSINFNSTGANTLTSTNNPSGAIVIFDANGDMTFNTPTMIDGSTFSSLYATNGSGTWTFNDLTILNQRGLNGGVDMFGNTGTVNFNNLNITTDSAGTGHATTGFLAGGNNIINVAGNSSINADGGAAVAIINANNIDITFDSLTSTNNTVGQLGFVGRVGIDLLNIGGGSFTVTGPTTLTNIASDGVTIDGATGTYTFASINANDIGRDALSLGVATSNPGTFNINGGTINNVGSDGVQMGSVGNGTSGGTLNLFNTAFSNITGFTTRLANSNVSGNGNTAVPFSSNNGGGNTGTILFNGGADSAP